MSFGSDKALLLNIPNMLTLSRIVMIPIMVVIYYLPFKWSGLVAAVLFAAAAITDWFDGYLARRLQQSTAFGAFLDPVADKLMVVVALVLLVEHHASWWFSMAALVIIAREVTISALREWMSEMGASASVSVSVIGKVKTTFQMIAIIGLLAAVSIDAVLLKGLAYLLLYSAVVLTLWSMWAYIRAAIMASKEQQAEFEASTETGS